MAKKKEGNPFVAIGSSLGGLLLGAIVLTAVLAQSYMWIVPIIGACFVVLGSVLGFFAYKAGK